MSGAKSDTSNNRKRKQQKHCVLCDVAATIQHDVLQDNASSFEENNRRALLKYYFWTEQLLASGGDLPFDAARKNKVI